MTEKGQDLSPDDNNNVQLAQNKVNKTLTDKEMKLFVTYLLPCIQPFLEGLDLQQELKNTQRQ